MNNLVINKLLGRGEYGKVYKAKNKNGRVVVIKNSDSNLRTERNIALKLSKFNVPAVYGYRELLISEFINGTTFKSYIKNGHRNDLKTLAYKVIFNLKKIYEYIPTFRHHDLHLDNIMVLPGAKVKILDFGLSTMKGIKNPAIGKFNTDYGIFPDSHHMYDSHLFLNSLYSEGILKDVIERLLPKEYLKADSLYVKNYRLKKDIDHTESLATFTYDNVLKALKSSTNNVLRGIIGTAAKKKPPKAKSPPKAKTQGEIMQKAIAILALQKKTPEKKKEPLKRPGLTKTNPIPLTKGRTPKKNNT